MTAERTRLRQVRRVPLLVLALLVCAVSLRAQPVSEFEVKAAFLLNFTKFIEWPRAAFPDRDAPLAICIVGKDPFGRALDDLVQGESVNGRKLAVRRLGQLPVPQPCQIMFFASAEKDLPRVLGTLGPGVLTVGEGESFLRGGGMIAFVVDNRRVRFDINQSAADAAGLRLSSRLLSVARSVEKSE